MHKVGDIVIASGNFYRCPDRVVMVIECVRSGQNKGLIRCEDKSGITYIGHPNDFFRYDEVVPNSFLWENINHNHDWLKNTPEKPKTKQDKLQQRVKELEERIAELEGV